MNKLLSMLTSGAAICASTAAFACPDPASGDANNIVAENAYDLLTAMTIGVDIGGSTPWSDCGIPGNGYLPSKASVRLDLRAAEGKQLVVGLTKGCPQTHMFVSAGDFRGTASGDPSTGTVSVNIPRANIGNDQTIMVYLSADSPGVVCSGEITFYTARG